MKVTVISSVHEVALSVVKRLRIIRLTNYPRPESSSLQDDSFGSDNERRREGLLFCRCRYVKIWATSRARKPVEEAIVFLTHTEADVGFGITPEILRQQWRGETALGGSYEVRGGRPDVVGLSGPAGIRNKPSLGGDW